MPRGDEPRGDLRDFGKRLGFVEKRVRAAAPRLGLDLARPVRGQQNDPRLRRLRADGLEDVEPLGAVRAGKPQVEDRERVVVLGHERLGFRDLARAVDGVALRGEVLTHRKQDRLLVVHDQNSGRNDHRHCKAAASLFVST